MTLDTAGQRMAADVGALLRARNALLWVVTAEEVRVERAIAEAAAAEKYEVRLWDCAGGVVDVKGETVEPGNGGEGCDCDQVLRFIGGSKQRAVWIMRDLPQWLKSPLTLGYFGF